MAYAVSVGNDVKIEMTGHSVTIPPNNYAKMMYYLSSISSCLEYIIPAEFTKYEKYYNLNSEEKIGIMTLCALLSPDLLLNKVIFMVPTGDPVLDGSTNNFYKITNASTVIAAATNLVETIVIGEKSVQVNKIMVFNEYWLKNYYINPLVEETNRLERASRATTTPVKTVPRAQSNYTSPSTYTSPVPTRTRPATSGESTKKSGGCGGCWCCCFYLLLLIAIVICIILPLLVIPNCRNQKFFLGKFNDCWVCLISKNMNCTVG